MGDPNLRGCSLEEKIGSVAKWGAGFCEDVWHGHVLSTKFYFFIVLDTRPWK